MIKVLIVDDSSFMRVKIRNLLETHPDIKVIGIARDGMDAIQKVRVMKPDVITMDINMPDLSGIQAVEQIMKECPTPIIMISSLTYDGARETLEALEKGAVDYIHKDLLEQKTLIEKIMMAKDAVVNISPASAAEAPIYTGNTVIPGRNKAQEPVQKSEFIISTVPVQQTFQVIGIGISTGGPKALAQIVPQLSPDIKASIIIGQHMPATFTKPLAERLNKQSRINVKEAENGEELCPGCVYICPGGQHIVLEKKGVISLYPKESFRDYHYCPAADLLMASISKTYGTGALCIIMTGMGADGLEGIKTARDQGSYVLAQSENSSTIYGMPKAIISNNLQHEIVHLDYVAQRINQLCPS